MRDNLIAELRSAAERWRKENPEVHTFALNYDMALREAADAIEEQRGYLYRQAQTIEILQKKYADAKAEIPRWIPVSEQLPEEDQDVLAWERAGFAYVDMRKDGKWIVADHNFGAVTHWIPLPEHPVEA